MGFNDELCFRGNCIAKKIGNTDTEIYICRFESTVEKLLSFDAYKIPYAKAVWSQFHSQWTNMFITKNSTISTDWCFVSSFRRLSRLWMYLNVLSRPALKWIKTVETKPLFLFVFGALVKVNAEPINWKAFINLLKLYTNGRKTWFSFFATAETHSSFFIQKITIYFRNI